MNNEHLELKEFNDKVIEILKEQNKNKMGVPIISLADPNIVVTKLDINNNPSLVFVQLVGNESDKLLDRVQNVILVLSIDDVEKYSKLLNWQSIINSNISINKLLNKPISELI